MVALTLDRGSESPAAGYAGAFVTVLIWAG